MSSPLTLAEFPAYFQELWGYEPFPWQSRLANQVLTQSKWPEGMALPTASGKTALIDIAVFLLALGLNAPSAASRSAPRRIVFVVNRRVIVDEAYERSRRIAAKLAAAKDDSVLGRVAAILRAGGIDSPSARPLATHLLRGGVYRDAAWCADPLQPAVICSTVDQVGSRVLFRGYGVSPKARPIEAALLGEDALWLIDEAHVSKPFCQTLREIALYRRAGWVKEPLPLPWHLVELTATPSDPAAIPFALDAADYAHPLLASRRKAAKPVKLLSSTAKKAGEDSDIKSLGESAAKMFKRLNAESALAGRASVVVFVNRVKTARAVYAALQADPEQLGGASVELVIGRMRGVDRDALTEKLSSYGLKTGQPETARKPVIVVSTQCLECGADLDFDGLVTECAALDALRQRFGRLNRAGRAIPAQAELLVPSEYKNADPIYGDALATTAKWLTDAAKNAPLDFGLAALEKRLATIPSAELAAMNTPAIDAPVLLPPIMDAWVQTCPTPEPDPDVAPFLHGPARERPQVQVLWRAGLTDETGKFAHELIAAIPPVAAETVAVPLGEMRDFLLGRDGPDEAGDLDHAAAPEEPTEDGQNKKAAAAHAELRQAYLWRDDAWKPFTRDSRLRPGDLVVLPAEAGGWASLAHAPDAPRDPLSFVKPAERKSYCTDHAPALTGMDISEIAALRARDKLTLRLGPGLPLVSLAPRETATMRALLAETSSATKAELLDAVAGWFAAAKTQVASDPAYDALRPAFAKLSAKPPVVERLADESTLLVYWPQRLHLNENPEETSARRSRQAAAKPIALAAHQQAVGARARAFAEKLLLPSRLISTLGFSGDHHDEGKRDPRFQALLRGGDRAAARFGAANPWAKSPRQPESRAESGAQAIRAGLPPGFRHELLSVRLVEKALASGVFPEADPALLLHLIGSHHGHGRPLVPAVEDAENPTVSATIAGHTLSADSATGLERYDSGVLRRFAALNPRYGRWGLAYLEALLRLADHQVSAEESTAD